MKKANREWTNFWYKKKYKERLDGFYLNEKGE
jgi:hypothetical protein